MPTSFGQPSGAREGTSTMMRLLRSAPANAWAQLNNHDWPAAVPMTVAEAPCEGSRTTARASSFGVAAWACRDPVVPDRAPASSRAHAAGEKNLRRHMTQSSLEERSFVIRDSSQRMTNDE